MGERDKRWDYLKGIAAVFVIVGHVIQYCGENNKFEDDIIYKIIYSFHMPLFMFICGITAVSSLNRLSFMDFLKNKFIRLMIPFMIWALIRSVCINAREIVIGHDIRPVLYEFTSILKTPEKGLWFLWVLFFISVISFILIRLGNKNKRAGGGNYINYIELDLFCEIA